MPFVAINRILEVMWSRTKATTKMAPAANTREEVSDVMLEFVACTPALVLGLSKTVSALCIC